MANRQDIHFIETPTPRAAEVVMELRMAGYRGKKPTSFARVTPNTQEYLDALWHEATL